MSGVRWGAWIPIGVYVAIVLAVSATFVPTTFGVSDKLVHALEFAGLAFLTVRGVALQFGQSQPTATLGAALLLTVGVGAADELTQSFAPLRTSDFADLRADALGALAGVLIGGLVYLRRSRLRRTEDEPPGQSSDPAAPFLES